MTETMPVESFRDAAPLLRRPFTAAAVKFKVQATWPKDAPTGGLIVAYIDARLAIERFNKVCPHLWSDHYRDAGNGLMWCDLTVDGVTRSDVGEGQGKALVSDALKRAAVHFGVGVSLYAIPKMMLDKASGELKPVQAGGKKSLALTPKGEARLRTVYAKWLSDHGSQAFGDPLDHGDLDGAAGDTDAEASEDVVTPEASSAPSPSEPLIEKAHADAILKDLKVIAEAKDNQTVARWLVAAGVQNITSVSDAVRALTPAQAQELEGRISDEEMAA